MVVDVVLGAEVALDVEELDPAEGVLVPVAAVVAEVDAGPDGEVDDVVEPPSTRACPEVVVVSSVRSGSIRTTDTLVSVAGSVSARASVDTGSSAVG
jgi:hypothetical protein